MREMRKRERKHCERGRSDFSLSRDEERSGAGERERKREKESLRERRALGRWMRNFPLSPYARVCPHAGEEEGRWGREGRRERGRRERERLREMKKREKEGERRGRARIHDRRKSCACEREGEREIFFY